MKIYSAGGPITIGNDLSDVEVLTITDHIFSDTEGELHIKTSAGTLVLEVSWADAQRLFSSVNRLTALMPPGA